MTLARTCLLTVVLAGLLHPDQEADRTGEHEVEDRGQTVPRLHLPGEGHTPDVQVSEIHRRIRHFSVLN